MKGALLTSTSLALAAIFAFAGLANAAAFSVQASLDSSQTEVGDSVTLSIECSGAQNVPSPAIQAPDGLQVQYLGPSTQVSFINGSISASVTHRYSVMPLEKGSYVLGPFTVSYDGKQYRTGTVRLDVGGGGTAAAPPPRGGTAPQGPRELRLTLDLAKKDAYVQERIPATVTLVVGNVRIDDVQYPTLDSDGFAIDPFSKPTQSREVRDGRSVQVVRFHTTIAPLRSGPLKLGPAKMSLSMLVSGRHGTGDPFFDRFFSIDPFAQRRSVEIHSDDVALNVRELPVDGRPTDFSGAVGRFGMEVSLKPTSVNVGDPITMRIRLSGPGNLATAAAPAVAAGADFKLYPPQATLNAKAGEKVFEQVLIPLHADVHELPAVRFSYFDPSDGRYRTISKGPFPIVVSAPAQSQAPEVVAARPAAKAAPPREHLGHDIVFIKDSPGTLVPRAERFYQTWWFLLLQGVPALIFGGAWWQARRRHRLHADPRYARFVRAGREARKALAAAEQALRGGEAARFEDTVSRALQDYLAAKLDLPPGGVDPSRVAARLNHNGASADVVERIDQVFGLLEQARYAPRASAASEREEALRLAQSIVAALERGGSRLNRRLGAAAMILAVVTAMSASAGGTSPYATFYKANTLYGNGQFKQAAAEYEKVLAAGVESAAVYYNLGNAYMKSDQSGLAILDYERARRLAPRDPDIRANLRFARDQDDVAAAGGPLWQRIVFPLGERMSTGELAVLASALWAALMLALTVRVLWPALAFGAMRVALACATLLLVALASVGYRLERYDWTTTAVVTQAGDSAVRFEPSTDGTTHFVAHEGTLLRVLEDRGDWLQVSRDDGRRGWIERRAVTDV